MRTLKKRIGMLALVALGLLVIACGSVDVITPVQGTNELRVDILRPEPQGNTLRIEVSGNRTATVLGEAVTWYYDVPNDQYEYALVGVTVLGSPRTIGLHLHVSKKPNPKP